MGDDARLRGASLEPGDSPGVLLWRATLRWQRLMSATLRPVGLTHVQFVLMASLWWLTRVAGERPTQHRVAEHAGTDPMMTSQVLRVLERRGLVTRALHPPDSRARQLAVTVAGVTLAQQAGAVVESADAESFALAAGRQPLIAFLRQLGASPRLAQMASRPGAVRHRRSEGRRCEGPGVRGAPVRLGPHGQLSWGMAPRRRRRSTPSRTPWEDAP